MRGAARCFKWRRNGKQRPETTKPEEIGEAFADLCNIDQVGPGMADDLAAFFGEPHNLAVLDDLAGELDVEDAEAVVAASPVAGKTVVFTGTLERISRSEAKARAEALGAKVGRIGLEENRSRDRRTGRGFQGEAGRRTGNRHPYRGRLVCADRRLTRISHHGHGLRGAVGPAGQESRAARCGDIGQAA